MKQYDATCPICGTENKGMYLEETDGWMECEHCHMTVKVMEFVKSVRIPVYPMEKAGLIFNQRKQSVAVNQ